ncbi:hypothetical protein BsWGS_18998 [Bradybaena similaris]
MRHSMAFAGKTSLIFQFQTGHARINWHLNHINPQHAPLCRHCSHPYETTNHLLKSPVLSEARQKLLQQSPNIVHSLYGTLGTAPNERICTFIKMTLRVNNSAAWDQHQQQQ